jgi:hypothetical protein
MDSGLSRKPHEFHPHIGKNSSTARLELSIYGISWVISAVHIHKNTKFIIYGRQTLLHDI